MPDNNTVTAGSLSIAQDLEKAFTRTQSNQSSFEDTLEMAVKDAVEDAVKNTGLDNKRPSLEELMAMLS